MKPRIMTAFGTLSSEGRPDEQSNESGSILILALVFMLVAALTVYSIVTWAGNSLVQTKVFNQSSALDYATGAAVQMSMQELRYSYEAPTSGYVACNPVSGGSVTLNGVSVSVYCQIVDNPDSAATRVITFDSCASTISESGCVASPFLQAVISYDDYSESNIDGCSSLSDQVTCGTAMSIDGWTLTG